MAGEQAACPGCNGDGTRWVTVGTLRSPMTDDLMEKPTYVIEEYVIEEASDAAG